MVPSTFWNPGGMSVSVLDYGCVIKNIIVPAKNGPVDVVVGYDTMADYEDDFTSSGSTCCGAFVGRYANRIENAVFTRGRQDLPAGSQQRRQPSARLLLPQALPGEILWRYAAHGSRKPRRRGRLSRYAEDRGALYPHRGQCIPHGDYRVSSDADTIVNLTNHSYFNLDGGGDVLNQKLRIYASRYLEGNNQCCPTGHILPVANTPMDFTAGKLIGKEIDTGFSQTTMVGGGYDHCYVIDRARGSSQSICAWATSDKTGISMKLYTTQPGIQLYTANFLQDCPAPARAASRCRNTAALRWRPSTTPAAPLTRSSPPRCCGQARCSAPPPPCGSSPASSAGNCKERYITQKTSAPADVFCAAGELPQSASVGRRQPPLGWASGKIAKLSALPKASSPRELAKPSGFD